ncbi:MAG: hypothetical protein IPG24_22155 [Leptospiraceae bacterium]|nr:hypothetical protein [Leptospiraceae bacterium]
MRKRLGKLPIEPMNPGKPEFVSQSARLKDSYEKERQSPAQMVMMQ